MLYRSCRLTFAILQVKIRVIYFLILLICFQAGGFLSVFKIRQWSIREEMDQGGGQTLTLVIPANRYEILKERGGREICWQGRRYDIKSLKKTSNLYILQAVWDKKEQSLIAGYTDWFKNSNSGSNKVLSRVIHLLTLEFYPVAGYNIPSFIQEIPGISDATEAVLSGFLGLYLQPPRVA